MNKYCVKHACYFENGKCQKCDAGLPGHIRPRSEVNPTDKKRIIELEELGLIEDKQVVVFEDKEATARRLKKQKRVFAELDRRHKKVMNFIKKGDWLGLIKFEADLKPINELL